MLTIPEIQMRLDAMPAAMSAKGLRKPTAKFQLEGNVASEVWLRHEPEGATFGKYEVIRAKTKNPADLLDRAEAWIAALPSREETKRREFMAAVGKAIELGRESHIEAEFVNPLTVLMKTLSENIITDEREAA